MRRIRKWLLAGIAVTLPTVVTAWLLWKIFNSVDRVLDPLAERWLGFRIPGLGFIAVILLLILAGFFAGNYFGRKLLQFFESIVERMPLAGKVYRAVRQILEVFTRDKTETFKSVVAFQYPRKGLWALGFVSRDTPSELLGGDDEHLYHVFLPTSPNPTSGYFLLVPEAELRHTSLTVEEAMKVIVSGGAYLPPDISFAGDSSTPEPDTEV